jgi:hypothetical protein
MRLVLRPLRFPVVLAAFAAAAAGSALTGCLEPTGCDDRQTRVPVRWGNDADLAVVINYHRMGYDCASDGHILDELGRGIGQWWVCSLCE